MENNIDDLKYIRSTMERSSKFLSLSGMSGVAAGLVALAGAAVAYFLIYEGYSVTGNLLADMIALALVVLGLALSFGLYFSYRKARKTKAKIWTPVSEQILFDAGIPLATGGLFCILLIWHHCSFLAASAMLIFYGISLINAGAKTYRDIKVLGMCQILIGLFAGFFARYGLFFWALGFGIMHIVYGIVMHIKYDAATDKKS